jgi:Protein of unknown function (DUF2628)
MAVYTVHQPPVEEDEAAPSPERFVFVRDGFSLWAFILGPVWMLRHRMWLALLGFVVVSVAVLAALRLAGVPPAASGFAVLMLALLVGIEAGTLRRFTLGRRRWSNVGTVVGSNRETVERRFFDAWVSAETIAPVSPAAVARATFPVTSSPQSQPPASGVIGLFPQPGAQR